MSTELPTSTIERKNLEYRFTNDELLHIAKKAAEEQTRLKSLEESKKMVMDEWKAKLSACQAEITNLSNKVTSGIEYRDYDCPVTYNDPKKGMKTCRHPDTGEVVYVKEMTQGEVDKTSQAVMDFDDEPDAPATEDKNADAVDAEFTTINEFPALVESTESEPEPEAPEPETPEGKAAPKKPKAKRTRKPKAKADADPAPEEDEPEDVSSASTKVEPIDEEPEDLDESPSAPF
ncbi:MAG TPA: hypothetical protein VNQ90_15495 [Chthoniobacteraceae bacterium]|nr:hypothetical protein [Chthoniobacteraceae bacterium]